MAFWIGVILCAGASGCTTAGPDMGAVLAVAPGEVPRLPETVAAVPSPSAETIVPLAAESTPPETVLAEGPREPDGTGAEPARGTDGAKAEAAAGKPAAETPGLPLPAPAAASPAAPLAVAAVAATEARQPFPPPVRPPRESPAAAVAPDGLPPVVAYAAPRPSGIDGRAEVERLIDHYAKVYGVPAELVRRVVRRESNFRPEAYNRGHWGLMQIKHATARGMGYSGSAEGLLDAETNLRYAVRYLRGAWLVAGGDHDQAVRYYARGYYYDAKRAGLLDETGLGRDRVRRRFPG